MGEPIRVLIVQEQPADIEVLRQGIAAWLPEVTFQIVETESGMRAALANFQPHVVLADYSLSEGMTVLHLAKAYDNTLPVILWTSLMNEDVAVEYIKAGASNYVLQENPKRLGPAVVQAVEERSALVSRKQAEAALLAQQRLSRALIENATDGIVLLRLNKFGKGRVSYASPSTARILGYDPDDLLGSDPSKLTHPDDLPAVLELLTTIIQDPARTITSEYRFRHRRGTWCWVESTFTNLLDDPNVNAVVINYREITERKRAEQNLRALADASREFGRTRDLHTIYTIMRHVLTEVMSADGLFVSAYDPETQMIRCAYAWDDSHELDVSALPLLPLEQEGRGTQSLAIRTGQAYLFNDFESRVKSSANAYYVGPDGKVEREIPDDQERSRSALIVPLKQESQVCGVLQVFSYRLEAYVPADLQFVESLGVHVSAAMGNARLFGELQRELGERQRAQDALLASESKFRSFVEQSAEGITLIDEDGSIIEWNHARETATGWKRSEVIGKKLWDVLFRLLPPDPATAPAGSEPYKSVVQEALATGQSYLFNGPIDGENISPEGERLYFQQTVFPIKTDKGYRIGSLTHDVTEMRRSAAQLQKLSRAVEQSPVSIIITDATGKIEYVNPQFARVTGYTLDHILGANPRFLKSGFTSEQEYQALWDTITSGREWHGEFRNRKANGELYWESAVISPIFNAQGAITHFVGVKEDITARKQAERALRESEARSRSRTQELELLSALSMRLRQLHTVEQILEETALHARAAAQADDCAVFLYEWEKGVFQIMLGKGYLGGLAGQTVPAGSDSSDLMHYMHEPGALADFEPIAQRLPPFAHANEIGPVAFVPLQSEERMLGSLMLTRHRASVSGVFAPETVRLLGTIGELAGNTLRRTRLFDEAQRRLLRAQSLYDVQRTISGSFDLQLVLDVTLDNLLAQLEVDAAAVLIFKPHNHMLEKIAARGFRTHQIEQTQLRLGDSYAGRAALERRTLFIGDIAQSERSFQTTALFAKEGFAAFCGVPLIAKGKLKGVLEIFHRKTLSQDEERNSFLETLAAQLAIAMDNLEMFSGMQQLNLQLSFAYDATIEGFARALDLRDKETDYHTQRVTDLCMQLARAMNVSDGELVHMRRGALLHDIGKIGIPDAILLKHGEFNAEEWDVMRLHPQYAYEILHPIEYLRPALDIPFAHHEWWDGSGYPRGLRGAQIPLAARIFSVADAWDALTSNRTYRPALSHGDALGILEKQSGIQFDPQVVQAFLGLADRQ